MQAGMAVLAPLFPAASINLTGRPAKPPPPPLFPATGSEDRLPLSLILPLSL
jgi:hypothetical protein